jgi:hypothetical protein
MTTAVRERVDEIIAGWLARPEEMGWDGVAGPLFPNGYAEGDITMTGGGGGDGSSGMTGCLLCTGSICNGMIIHCA